jgi:hypothetical protein
MRYTRKDLVAWLRTHGTIRGGSTNQTDVQGMNLNLACPAAANSGVGPNSNDPIIFGRGTSPTFGLAGVVQTNYTPPTGVATGYCSIALWGVFNLSVVGKASIGGAGLAFAPGDRVYAAGGTYDITTGVLYGFTLNGDATNGVHFGIVLDPVVSGATTIVRVRLKTGS